MKLLGRVPAWRTRYDVYYMVWRDALGQYHTEYGRGHTMTTDKKIHTDPEGLKATIDVYNSAAAEVQEADSVLAWRIKRCAVEMEALLGYIQSRTEKP